MRRSSSSSITRIAFLLCLGAASGWLTAADDLSEPRPAARAFTDALGRGDAEAAKAAATGERIDMEFVDAIVAVVGSRNKLNATADEKFGPATQPISGVGPSYSLGAPERTLVVIDGDVATLSSESGFARMKLRKADGQWRVDLPATRGKRKDVQATIKRMEVLSAALDAITECIRVGAYADRAEAQRGLLRLVELANASVPTTMPSVAKARIVEQ